MIGARQRVSLAKTLSNTAAHFSALAELQGCERTGAGGRARLGAVRTERGKEVRLQITNAEDENLRTRAEKCRSEAILRIWGFSLR